MKKTKLVCLLAGVLFSTQSFALDYGILGGLNFYSPSYSNPSGTPTKTSNGSSSSAFGVSVSTGIIPLLTLEVDALYVSRKSDFLSTTAPLLSTTSFHVLEIPALVRLSLVPALFNVGAGLYYAMGLGSVNVNGVDYSYSDAGFNKTEVGAVLTAEVRLPVLTLFSIVGDMRYNYGFSELSAVSTSQSLKTRELQMFVGVSF